MMAELRALVIGASLVDLMGTSRNSLIKNDSNPGNISITSGGVGRNIAHNLALLGVEVHLITVVGDDVFGTILLQHCKNAGIQVSNSLIIPGVSSAVYLAINNPSGDLEIAISDTEILEKITPEFLATHSEFIHQFDIIVLDTNVSSAVLEYICLHYSHKKIFVDLVSTTKAKKIIPFLSYLYAIKPNLAEAMALSNQEFDRQLMKQFFLKSGVKEIFVSLGEKGCEYFNQSETGTINAAQIAVVNSSGAGDAFMAGLVYGCLKKFSIRNSAQFGMSCATLALMHTATVNPELNLTQVTNIQTKYFQYD